MMYVWYSVKMYEGLGVVADFLATKPQPEFTMTHKSPSSCSWLIPTWDAFERASE